jgi:nitrogen regulatory protein PII
VDRPSIRRPKTFDAGPNTSPEATLTATYRGAAVEQHSRPKARLECVVGADHASTVVETVIKDGGERSFVFVVPVESAYPAETIKTDVPLPAG